MDKIVDKLVEDYKVVVDKALADTDASEAHTEVIRDKFIAKFRANIEIGLTAVFGKHDNNGSSGTSAPLTEIGVEDVMKKGMLTLRKIFYGDLIFIEHLIYF